MMKVSELIELLQEMNADDEVRIGTQPNYPIAVSIAGVAGSSEPGIGTAVCQVCGHDAIIFGDGDAGHKDDDIDTDHLPEIESEDGPAGVVWIAAGDSDEFNPYEVPANLWDRAGGGF